MHKLEIRHVVMIVLALTVIGIILYSLNKSGALHIPNTIEIGQSGTLLAILVFLYFVLGFLILYIFFKPKGIADTSAIAGASILWGIY